MALVSAYGVARANAPLELLKIERRELGPNDVEIAISHCGICHCDLHFAHGEWGAQQFPAVPGHEIVGMVSRIGANVKTCKPGQSVGVGCMVDSCHECSACHEGEEQFCERGQTGTYMGVEKQTGLPTHGGYSKAIMVNQDFVLHIPEG